MRRFGAVAVWGFLPTEDGTGKANKLQGSAVINSHWEFLIFAALNSAQPISPNSA